MGYEQKRHESTKLSSFPFPSVSCCLFCDHGEELTIGTSVTSWGEQSPETVKLGCLHDRNKRLPEATVFEVWLRPAKPYPDEY